MPSKQQTQANRENAQLSTGPTTETGKQASRVNALRHGLTATSIDNFPIEMREDYELFRQALEADMAPASQIEQLYFEHFAFAHFLALRAQSLEIHAMQQAILSPNDEQAIKRWKSNSRYARAHAQAAQKALNTFREFQADRYNAVLIQDEITHELNSSVTVPISAPLTNLLKPSARQHNTNQTALCVVYGEKQRERFTNQSTLRNEPNLSDNFE